MAKGTAKSTAKGKGKGTTKGGGSRGAKRAASTCGSGESPGRGEGGSGGRGKTRSSPRKRPKQPGAEASGTQPMIGGKGGGMGALSIAADTSAENVALAALVDGDAGDAMEAFLAQMHA